MTIEERIEVMKAFADGYAIEVRPKSEYVFHEVRNPVWNWEMNEYRVASSVPGPIDWDVIHQDFNYIAMDADGKYWAYENLPTELSSGWQDQGGSLHCMSELLSPKFFGRKVLWQNSLMARPGHE